MDIYNKSIQNEIRFLNIIRNYFNDYNINKTINIFDRYDYLSNKYKIELKTRYNISKKTYDYLLVPESKIYDYDNNFIYIFLFYFDKDNKLYYYQYNIDDYNNDNIYIKKNHMGRNDRGKNEINDYLFIHNKLLIEIPI